jgi:hypothetical protein
MEINQPKSVKRKMRGRKLRSGVAWLGALKQIGVKQTSVKQGFGVYLLYYLWRLESAVQIHPPPMLDNLSNW